MTSIVTAAAITSMSATWAGRIGASSSARTRAETSDVELAAACRGTSPYTAAISPTTIRTIPRIIGVSTGMPASLKPKSRASTYMGRWRITPAMTATTPAWNSTRCPYMLTRSEGWRQGTLLPEVEPLRNWADERQRDERRGRVEGDRQWPAAVGGDADQRF